jgi:CRISPR-associated endonuclease Csn1
MKKILGLDLGVASIGWALINVENDIPIEIVNMGSRIVPLTTDDANEFSSGNAISKNQNRTKSRTQRKGYDRYQMRRKNLTDFLRKYNMLPTEELIKLDVLELWGLRAKAVNETISLTEIGRILYHLNQKRGYKSAKSDETEDKKQKDYVANVNNRYKKIKELNKTIGQYFYDQLLKDKHYRTKDQVFPRAAYVEEFDKIWDFQSKQFPSILTEENKSIVRNEIIYYQRSLKSCKHLVSLCEFEKKSYINKEGKTVFDGPKVAPRTSPLFQVCKIWESANNLVLKNRKGEELYITAEQKLRIFNHLDNNDKLTLNDLYSTLQIKKTDGWWGGKAIGRGLQGNTTKIQLKKALGETSHFEKLLQFNLHQIDTKLVDPETGEIVQQIDSGFINEPLYRLWHTVYSIHDKKEFENTLIKNFGITEPEIIEALYKIDFVKPGFSNKSSKAIRKILPYLQIGLKYSEACEAAGFRHSESLTVAENQARQLLSKLPQIKKNELKQPIVEKILNQMINLVNQIIEQYGQLAEIRVELARELKQSRDERNATDKNMRLREKENDIYAKRISQEYELAATRTRIQKFRMWEEAKQKCFYCGQPVNVKEFLNGFDVEVEHIIPKSLLFDDSFSNKVCSCRKCNSEKGNRTAFDYMTSKSEIEFDDYLQRIEEYYKNGDISKTKKERLLTPKDKIPTDFIDRQLRETQYISRKAKEILSQVARNVWATSGSVTDFVRHTWGWDNILHDLQFEKYKITGQTEIVEYQHKNQTHTREQIKGWSKRLDHRHHAIDALTVACTKQSYIQRLNNLNTERDAMFQELKNQNEELKEKFTLLEKWLNEQPHFSKEHVQSKVAEILVSFKAGKKAASTGKRIKYANGKKIVLQEGIIVPRGALHEEGVYGRIYRYKKNESTNQVVLKPETVKKYNMGVGAQGFLFTGKETYDRKTKTDKTTGIVEFHVEDKIKKVIDSIVDKKIQSRVLERLNRGFEFGQDYKNDVKKALSNLKNLKDDPIFLNEDKKIPIKSVRCFTGRTAIEPIKYNDSGEPIAFVNPGNNHHIAIYKDRDGEIQELSVTFWHAVERKRFNIPTVIKKPEEIWDYIQTHKTVLPDSFLKNLPEPTWTYVTSLLQNEMFIYGMSADEINEKIHEKDFKTLSDHIYRVQNIATKQYFLRLHTETKDLRDSNARGLKLLIQASAKTIVENTVKIKINCLGTITVINENTI